MIQKITIDVEVPDGYEATGEWRWPNADEPFLTVAGTVCTMHIGDTVGRRGNRIILRKKWAFPAWFPNGWWLMYCGGDWYVRDYVCGAKHVVKAEAAYAIHGEVFTPPTPLGVGMHQCTR